MFKISIYPSGNKITIQRWSVLNIHIRILYFIGMLFYQIEQFKLVCFDRPGVFFIEDVNIIFTNSTCLFKLLHIVYDLLKTYCFIPHLNILLF